MSEADVRRGMKEMDETQEKYIQAKRFYDGNVREVFANEKIAQKLRNSSPHYRVNLAKIPVKAIYNRLEITSISVPEDDSASSIISEIRNLDETKILESTIHRRTGEFGDSYVLMLPSEEDEQSEEEIDDEGEEVEDEETPLTNVEFYYNNPLCMRVIYSDEHSDHALFAIKRWRMATSGSKEVWRVNLYYPNTIERWMSQADENSPDGIRWLHYLSNEETEESWPIQTDFGQIPVIHFRSDVPYGVPDHEEAYGPQNAINKLIITQMSTIESAGFPQRWALENDNNLDSSMDDPDWEDDASAQTDGGAQGGVSSGLRTGPGTTQVLTGIKSTGQYESADPRVFSEPLEIFIGLMSAATSTPLNEFKVGGQQPSGDSQREVKANLIENVKFRQLMLGVAWSEFWKMALIFGADVDVNRVKVEWRPADTVNDKEGWDTFEVKDRLGVPIRAILLEAGYTPDELDEWGIPDFKQTDMIQDLTTTASLMQAIGVGLEKIAAATATGIISQEAVDRLMNDTILPTLQELKDSGE